ncbi:UPF0545 protein C22orf39 homolog [Pollicipes pollicipes]|uniref:UPF0545 protein C22orf39 homolog n=1 Tax=Pollicipes pollicipes TaxID=41117 RepID=UPI001884CB20|nr:UPF0545 protein C22orf39 homolog [Pollicipes pollicipes]XP_037072400.1 UPF0545 protein C22orf39 homolog [Pollicipes pollicipes]XP_037072402.1 UPF0545 protein C22orf39 homolog [Pollicipes pollicipes]XP_037072403.1 UPF0545 protein C22orf39 homolog [Pollicipes pollicipes]XP_037072404.1 UPF0545 protein C22orf39 homolog [Pollicipes pollicipes]
MTAEVDLATEISHLEQLPADAWLVRSCELLQQELKECRRPKGRFHQYFIDGQLADCSQWRDDVERCLRWRRKADADAMAELVESERARRNARLAAHRANDVWESRGAPPPGWNGPLPEHLERKRQRSFLHRMQAEDEARPAAEQPARAPAQAARCVLQ